MPISLHAGEFYGTLSQKRELRDFRLIETTYHPESIVPVHTHEHAYFCCVVAGSFEESSRGKTREHVPQDLIFHPACEAHADRFHGSGGRCFNLEMNKSFLERMKDDGPLFLEPAKFRNSTAAWLAMRLHREFRRTDSAAFLAAEGLAFELVSEFFRRAPAFRAKAPLWLTRVRDLLHARFSEPLSLSEIAESVDLHPSYLARTFRRHLQMTVGDYVRRLRIEFACRQLAGERAALSEIAHAAGFADQSHFTRTFRKMTGLSPGRYRAQNAKKSI